MLNLLTYSVFAITVALASLGVFVSSKLRISGRPETFGNLLYQQVFIYTFGFYSIWGQAVIDTFLSEYVSTESLLLIKDVAALIGFPFMVFSWLMLLQFVNEISGRKSGKLFNPLFLLINFLLVLGTGYAITLDTGFNSGIIIRGLYIILNGSYFIAASAIVVFAKPEDSALYERSRNMTAVILTLTPLLQIIPLIYSGRIVSAGLIFIFLFFIGNAAIPAYIYFTGSVKKVSVPEQRDLSFDDFCKKFEVSPRESDIIKEICNGLSNKDISEKLFISLQTVKDHTHRIYIKTNVKSRVQLINLVKDHVLTNLS